MDEYPRIKFSVAIDNAGWRILDEQGCVMASGPGGQRDVELWMARMHAWLLQVMVFRLPERGPLH